MLEVRLLGAFDARVDGKPIAIPTRPAQSLLAYLLLNAGAPQRREKLAALLWPEAAGEAARRNLRLALWRLRGALKAAALPAEAYVLADGASLTFDRRAPHWLDAAVLAAPSAGPEAADDLIRRVSVYAEDLLPGFDDPWVEPERERLRALFERQMAALLGQLAAERRWLEMLEWAERWLALNRAAEPAYRALLSAYAALGDMAALSASYQRCVKSLRDELGLVPSRETQALYAACLRGEPRPGPSPTAPPLPAPASRHNLPSMLTNFIGREHEIGAIKQRLVQARLVTLTGAGGCGKTRLAIQTALSLVGNYADGVWLVELAALSDPDLAPQAIASSVGVREEPGRALLASLSEQLRARRMLLVLDNCEHLIDAAALAARTLLRACPRLQILATSREALRIAGEASYAVPPLSMPDPERPVRREHLLLYEATRLFVDRAALAQPAFRITEQNSELIARVCRRLDGIPLALELAAARLRMLSLEEIAGRLNDRFQLLTGDERGALPQHRTLRASIDWSFDLLTEPERALLRRLSVFAGGGTMPAVEAVGGADALDLLTRLVDKSLVITEPQGEATRYRLPETIRQYAQERLAAAGELNATRDGHLRFYLQMAQAAEPELEGAMQGDWLERLQRDHDNLRAALDWAGESGQTDLWLTLSLALRQFWFMRGHLAEGRARLEAILALPAGALLPAARAQALNSAALLARYQADYAGAQAHIREGLAIHRQLGDPKGIADALSNLGYVTLQQGDAATARALYEESLALNRGLGNPQGVGDALTHLAQVAALQNEYDTANALDGESLAIFRQLGDQQGVAWVLHKLGKTAVQQGQAEAARRLFAESLALCQQLGHQWGLAIALEGFAGVAAASGQPEQAARLAGAASVISEAAGIPLSPVDQAWLEPWLKQAREALAPEVYAAAWAQGRALPTEQAARDALEAPGSRVDPADGP